MIWMMKAIVLLLCSLFALAGFSQSLAISLNDLREGDLLFCVKDKGNQITDVTQGVGGMKIDHVAILHRTEGGTYALEAIHKGVSLTPIDSFMARRDMVLAARLKDTVGVARSVVRALRFLGKPYDFNFMPSDSAFDSLGYSFHQVILR